MRIKSGIRPCRGAEALGYGRRSPPARAIPDYLFKDHQHADRLVLWNYIGLSGATPEYTASIARYVRRYGVDRIIISYGLWAKRGAVLDAEALQQAMVAGQEGNLPHAWITPLGLMQEEHWQTLAAVWRDAAGCAPALTPPQRAPDR